MFFARRETEENPETTQRREPAFDFDERRAKVVPARSVAQYREHLLKLREKYAREYAKIGLKYSDKRN